MKKIVKEYKNKFSKITEKKEEKSKEINSDEMGEFLF